MGSCAHWLEFINTELSAHACEKLFLNFKFKEIKTKCLSTDISLHYLSNITQAKAQTKRFLNQENKKLK